MPMINEQFKFFSLLLRVASENTCMQSNVNRYMNNTHLVEDCEQECMHSFTV